MAGAYGDIARVLQGTRRRQVRVVLLAALAFGAATAVLCLLAGAIALSLGARTAFRAVPLAGAIAGLLGAAGFALDRLLRTAWDDAGAARTLARQEPGLRSALLSSVELTRAREGIAASGGLSLALVDAHVERTAERALAVDLAQAVPDRQARQAGVTLLVAVGLSVFALAIGGGPLRRAYARVLRGDPPGAPAVQVDPITGDIEITYRYPAYMKRDPRTLAGTGGELRAPRGTEVLLVTRADRQVKAAELVVEAEASAGTGKPGPDGKTVHHFALAVAGERGLSGRFVLDGAGSYRFRYLDAKGRAVAEGPPIPIVLEPDEFPQARLTAPAREIEVDAGAVVDVEWQAEDDFGLSEVALVLKPPAGPDQRRVLRRGDPLRRDGGTHPLALAPERLAEGEKLLYWLEAVDGDTVSGPKKAASETHTIKIYSEAEHRRAMLERARQAFEELVALLGDRLETFAGGSVATDARLPLATALDHRTRRLHEALVETARDLRRDRAAPRQVAAALSNVAGNLRVSEQRLTAVRGMVAQSLRVRIKPDATLVRNMGAADAALDAQLEKGILYLEQLLDKQRAEDLVRLAKDLAGRRRDLAGLMEKYRAAPTEQGKKELVAQIGRMKERVQDLLARMAELSKGFNDEHMNDEALAELAKSQDLVGGLDEVEKKLAAGDVEGAMKALDQMASAMDRMVAGLQRTAGRPDEKAQALMKEMLAFKEKLEKVEAEQQQGRGRHRGGAPAVPQADRRADEGRGAGAEAAGRAGRAGPAGRGARAAGRHHARRAGAASWRRSRSRTCERALAMRSSTAPATRSQRAQPVGAAARHGARRGRGARRPRRRRSPAASPPRWRRRAGTPARRCRRCARSGTAASACSPTRARCSARTSSSGSASWRSGRTSWSARRGSCSGELAGARQEGAGLPALGAAAARRVARPHGPGGRSELGARNPQRGHGEQELALDALERFKKGLEEAAKSRAAAAAARASRSRSRSRAASRGEGLEASREKVKIPGAEAHKVPEEFRKDLLDAMKQGAPERYRSEVQRYYEELVK